MIDLASQYGRYGYRRITRLLVDEVWRVNHKRVQRLWRRGCRWLATGRARAPQARRFHQTHAVA